MSRPGPCVWWLMQPFENNEPERVPWWGRFVRMWIDLGVGLWSWLRERCVVDRRPDRDGDVAVAVPGEDLTDEEKSLLRRVDAVEDFVALARRLISVEDLKWADASADYRLLAINVALRRQLESIDAACLLCRNGLGQLAIALVRPSIEDVIYLDFFRSLKLADSQKLFLLMSRWDQLRSLLAQRDYIGDADMEKLWYSKAFLDAAEQEKEQTRVQLKALQQQFGWPKGRLPSAEWVAKRTGRHDLYDYLHAATSRAIHFSAGEIMRRGWGHPRGIITTGKPEFRAHIAAFALDQLWRRWIDTWGVAISLGDKVGVSSDESLSWDEMKPAIDRLLALNHVPLVHAHEWNLTPDGPLDLS
jgi:hypothetical protein